MSRKFWLSWDDVKKQEEKDEVPPRFELGSLDSESRVLTITPWDLVADPGHFLSSDSAMGKNREKGFVGSSGI